jgi:hypothetical protein
MPNQDIPPVFQPQTDLPPLPPEFESASGVSGTTTVKPNPDNGKPKKKFGSGRIIATILGILVLVGGVTTGVILTSQRQLLEQKASYPQPSNCPPPGLCFDDYNGQCPEGYCGMGAGGFCEGETVACCQPLSYCTPSCTDNGTRTCNPDCSTECGYAGGTISTCVNNCGAAATKNCPAIEACLPTSPSPAPASPAAPTQNSCGGTCSSDANCLTGYYICYQGFCRDKTCPERTDCTCPVTSISVQTTPLPIPTTGINWPTILSTGVGILVVLGSLLIAL